MTPRPEALAWHLASGIGRRVDRRQRSWTEHPLDSATCNPELQQVRWYIGKGRPLQSSLRVGAHLLADTQVEAFRL